MSATSDDFGASQHLGEDAELYALAALDRAERERIEAHAAACAPCARALAEALVTVAALDDAYVTPVPPPTALTRRIVARERRTWPMPAVLATAASVLLAIGVGAGTLLTDDRDAQRAARESTVIATLANAHFLHVSLTKRDPGAPVSKAIYARDGTWLYVVIDSATCDCRVRTRTAAGERDLGSPDARGSTATLFARDIARPSAVELVDGAGRVRAAASLAYPPP